MNGKSKIRSSAATSPVESAGNQGPPPRRRPGAESTVAGAVLDTEFRVPSDLEITLWTPRRLLVLGSCLADTMQHHWSTQFQTKVDYILVQSPMELPNDPPSPVDEYDIQVILPGLRFAMIADKQWAAALRDGTSAVYFEQTVQRVRAMLQSFCKWTRPPHRIPTLVAGFIAPQSDLTGRHQPRFDFTNLTYFIERLNAVIAEEAALQGARYLDIDAVAACFGKRYICDDVFSSVTHGAFLADFDYEYDTGRIDGPRSLLELYPQLRTPLAELLGREVEAMVRTWRRIDEVKLVVWDLDDTLWRGVAAEGVGIGTGEGWPCGLYDAVHALHHRGILQAILSKNDDTFIRSHWNDFMAEQELPISMFAATRISFEDKPSAMTALLKDVGLTPKSIVFVDDNPVERAAMSGAFPDMRVLGANHLALKRILLSAPELQIAVRTAESAERTAMVQAQVSREVVRRSMGIEEFLESLDVQVCIDNVLTDDAQAIERALELVNKTNQFNTLGTRYTPAQFANMVEKGSVYSATVRDRFSAYGLVVVAFVEDAHIPHFVMSCRVLGLGVEQAVMAALHRQIAAYGWSHVTATLAEHGGNRACHEFWATCGYTRAKDSDDDRLQIWTRVLDDTAQQGPAHVTSTIGTKRRKRNWWKIRGSGR